MKEVTLLISTGVNMSNNDFLATLEPLHISSNTSQELPFMITLNRYSRDPWSIYNTSESTTSINDTASSTISSSIWVRLWMKSTDGRHRLPKFLNYLKDRRKAAYGIFNSSNLNGNIKCVKKAVFVVPFEAPPLPSEVSKVANDFVFVKYCLDEASITGEYIYNDTGIKINNPYKGEHERTGPDQELLKIHYPQSLKQVSSEYGTKTSLTVRTNGGGLLMNLLGAQRRTKRSLAVAPINRNNHSISQLSNPNLYVSTTLVINSFRSYVEKILKKFYSDSTKHILTIPIILADQIRTLCNPLEAVKVSLKLLEYIVYDIVEEIDKLWVAVKEKDDNFFVDESTIVVYKSGYIPAYVLDDNGIGELPDDVIRMKRVARIEFETGQRRILKIEQERITRELHKSKKRKEKVSMLNIKKKDRRTIEEIQRDMRLEKSKVNY